LGPLIATAISDALSDALRSAAPTTPTSNPHPNLLDDSDPPLTPPHDFADDEIDIGTFRDDLLPPSALTNFSSVNCLPEAILYSLKAKRAQVDSADFERQADWLPRASPNYNCTITTAAVILRRCAGFEALRIAPLGSLHTRLLDRTASLTRQDALTFALTLRMSIRIYNITTGEVWTTPVSLRWPRIDLLYDLDNQHYKPWRTVGNVSTPTSYATRPWHGG
jgi:hypothetical protein